MNNAEIILKHLDCMENEVKDIFIAAYSKDSFVKFRDAINGKNKARIHEVFLPEQSAFDVMSTIKEFDVNASIVFLTDFDNSLVMKAHAATLCFKDKGMIVTSCFARSLFYDPPKDVGGITYQGIFDRTGKFVAGIDGDYLEFGVFDGRTLSLAYHTMKQNRNMRFWAFDSYAGIIGKSDGETNGYDDGNYYSNIQTFYHNMNAANVDLNRVTAVKGNFLEILSHPKDLQSELKIKRCAVLHIDCDVYLAAKAALNFCSNLLTQGSIILFDEYHANHASNSLGERRALKEWLNEHPELEVEKWHDYSLVSRAYIVHTSK